MPQSLNDPASSCLGQSSRTRSPSIQGGAQNLNQPLIGLKGKKVKTELIVDVPLEFLKNTVFDLTPYATEERYRFIDCDAFVNAQTLRIYETAKLPYSPYQTYTVISYVWLALPALPEDLERDGSFRVYCGARNDGTIREDGGPIGMKVLGYVCRWSLEEKAPLLWLDRLCILQTSKRDKHWQISRMFDIYEACNECVVLPGGLQRLASVFEETTWAERAWTYQESIITWDYAVVFTKDWFASADNQQWFIDGECHWQYLQMLFIEGSGLLAPRTELGDSGEVIYDIQDPRLILGRNKESLDALSTIVSYMVWNNLNEEEDHIDEFAIQHLVVQGVQMRVSSRPVDMVLSILSLVNVEEEFEGRIGDFEENERFHATLAMVEVMLRNQDEDNSLFLDIPLWVSLELVVDAHTATPHDKMVSTDALTLEELAAILDNNLTDIYGIPSRYKVSRLENWMYDVEYTDELVAERAKNIVGRIDRPSLLSVYEGEKDRMVFDHEDEGRMEILRSIDIKNRQQTTTTIMDDPDASACVFAWSLRREGQPVIRFYKLGLSDAMD